MEARPELDLLMASAWPAARVVHEGGWQFRFTEGVTRRANSVLTVGEPDDLEATIEEAERFYAALAASPIFYVSEATAPARLAEILADRGYGPSATTWILWTETDSLIAATQEVEPWSLDVSDAVGDAWFDTYWTVEAARRGSVTEAAVLRDVLLRPDATAVFASALDPAVEGVAMAVGQAVIQDGWACVQCLVTRPEARRHGAARAILSRLATEASGAGADRVFAAVMADNPASLRLFEGASFRRSHRYSYFSRLRRPRS